jgi:hypothetical protein
LLSFDAAQKQELIADKRFEISQYTGHNGWIDLDAEDEQDCARHAAHFAQRHEIIYSGRATSTQPVWLAGN